MTSYNIYQIIYFVVWIEILIGNPLYNISHTEENFSTIIEYNLADIDSN